MRKTFFWSYLIITLKENKIWLKNLSKITDLHIRILNLSSKIQTISNRAQNKREKIQINAATSKVYTTLPFSIDFRYRCTKNSFKQETTATNIYRKRICFQKELGAYSHLNSKSSKRLGDCSIEVSRDQS